MCHNVWKGVHMGIDGLCEAFIKMRLCEVPISQTTNVLTKTYLSTFNIFKRLLHNIDSLSIISMK